MDITEIARSISMVGFPSVMCIILFVYLQKSDDKRERDTIELRRTIDNNTKVMNSLLHNVKALIEHFTS